MLARFPAVRQREHTSDVAQEVSLKLFLVLADVKPRDSKHFLCLAALIIRRKLLDLAARVGRVPRPEADRVVVGASGSAPPCEPPDDHAAGPQVLAQWTEIHNYIQGLPEPERELFDLLFYHEFKQEEAAEVLGVSYRTLKRHWQKARLAFIDRFGLDPFSREGGGPNS
jgi:RNA polymerase sigma factor (sigma-70 family)